MGIAYLAIVQRHQLPGGSISESGERGASAPCIDWLQASGDSRPGHVRLEWRTTGANHVVIGRKVFGPDGTARVRLRPGGWIALTPVSRWPRRAGLAQYVFLMPRCEIQRPMAMLAAFSARLSHIAQRDSPRRAAWAPVPVRRHPTPDAPRFDRLPSKWGSPFERYAGSAPAPLILAPDLTDRTAHEGG